MRGRRCAVRFAERMSARNQCDGLFIVHAHVAERCANRCGCRQRLTAGVWPFRIDVNQPHFSGR
ncbi:hypothetical protein D3C80_999540 [compost metagenome]